MSGKKASDADYITPDRFPLETHNLRTSVYAEVLLLLRIGAHFSQEYAFESAALFNPSVVALPDEESSTPGAVRFVMSPRGIGKGHISSITATSLPL